MAVMLIIYQTSNNKMNQFSKQLLNTMEIATNKIQQQSTSNPYKFIFDHHQNTGTIRKTHPSSKPTTLLRITKSINYVLTDQTLNLQIILDQHQQVFQLICSGHGWFNLMLSMSLLSRRYSLYRNDVLDTLAFFPSTFESIEFYDPDSDRPAPRL